MDAAQLAVIIRMVDEASSQLRQVQGALKDMGAAADDVSAQAANASREARALQGALGTVSPEAARLTSDLDSLAQVTGSRLTPNMIAGAGAAAILATAAVESTKSAIEWESALAGVAKTLDTTGLSASEAEAEVERIGDELRQLALEIPIAATELAGVAEAAGQLGVAREDVVSFAEVMAKLGVTTDLSAEQAAVSIARIANITGLASDEIDNFAAALVDLGNNSAATEAEILAMATRIAAAGNMAGLSEGEILGLAAALTSVGVQAEAGGTAVMQTLASITEAVETADERLALFAEVAGMTAQQFADTWRNEPAVAIAAFIEGLAEIEATGGSSILMLQALELAGVRQSQALRSAAGAGDLMRESMERGNEAFEDAVALNEEAALRFKTTESQIQLFKNSVEELKIEVGEGLLPTVNLLLQLTIEMTREIGAAYGAVGDLIGLMPDLVSWMGKYIERAERAAGVSVDWTEALKESAKDVLGIVNPAYGAARAVNTYREALSDADDAQEEVSDSSEELAGALGAVAEAARDAWTETKEHGYQLLVAESGANKFINQLDFLRVKGQEAAQTTRLWADALGAIQTAVAEQPEALSGFMETLVTGFREGYVELEDIAGLIAQIPEDVLHDQFIPALQDLRVEWLSTIAEMGDPSDIATARQNLAALDEVLQGVGLSLESLTLGIGAWGDVQDLFQLQIDVAAERVGEWEGHLKGAERALKFLQDQIDAGIPLTEEQQRQYEALTWATERYAGGVEDEAAALIDAEVAKAEYIRLQDELNQALADGTITQEEANEMLAEAAARLDPATAATMGLVDAQGKLQEGLQETIRQIVELLVQLGILDETEAEAILGVDASEADREIDRMQTRLDAYEGSTYTAILDLNTLNAINAYEGFRQYLRDNPASIDLYVGQTTTMGLTQRAGGGPIQAGQVALVGEEGPELIVPSGDVHVFSNPDTRRLLSLMDTFAGGFAEGTTDLGAGSGTQGVIDIGTGFTELGTAIAEAIALGVRLGLIESGEPSGSEYAQAIIKGVQNDIGRLPDLAAGIGGDVVIALLDRYADLQGELQLAILSGEDTSKIQAELDTIFGIFAAWSGNTVTEVEAVWSALEDEQRAEKARQMWDDVLGSLATPAVPASFSLEDLVSGDALAQLRADFAEIYNLQKILKEAGFDELAGELGSELAALGLQEEFINALLGTDTAQKLAEQMELEKLGEELDSRLAIVLGDDPLQFYDRIQGEIDSLQEKIDLGPLLGVPQEIIDGWIAEQEALKEQQDQFWQDMAAMFVAGMLDPEILAQLDEAGQIMLGNAIMGLAGPHAYEAFEAALAGLGKVSEEGIEQLAEIFAEAPEIAVEMIDDIIAAVLDGAMSWDQAMSLLADVPRKDLVPALLDLEQQLTRDLAEAILMYGPDSPEVQAILEGLGLIEGALDEVGRSADTAAESVRRFSGTPQPVGGDAGDAGGSAAPRGGGSASFNRLLETYGIALEPGARAVFDGFGPTVHGQSLWAAIRDQAILYLDADGLSMPGRGFELYSMGDQLYVNPFDLGGIPKVEGLGLLKPHDVILTEQSPVLDSLVETLLDKLEARGDAGGGIHIYIDGRDVAGEVLKHVGRGALTGQAVGQ